MPTEMCDLSVLGGWSSLFCKNTHKLLYCGCTRTNVIYSLCFLFESAQLRLVYIVACASRSCNTDGNPLSVPERKDEIIVVTQRVPTLGYHRVLHGTICK